MLKRQDMTPLSSPEQLPATRTQCFGGGRVVAQTDDYAISGAFACLPVGRGNGPYRLSAIVYCVGITSKSGEKNEGRSH